MRLESIRARATRTVQESASAGRSTEFCAAAARAGAADPSCAPERSAWSDADAIVRASGAGPARPDAPR